MSGAEAKGRQVRADSRPAIVPDKRGVPASLLVAYKRANTYLVEAPSGIDTVFGAALVSSVFRDGFSWQHVAQASFDDDQITDAGRQLSILHHQFGVPVYVEGFDLGERREDALRLTQRYLVDFQRPAVTHVYAVDSEGILRMSRDRLGEAYESLRNGCVRAAANFARGIMGLPLPEGEERSESGVMSEDIAVLTEFSDPRYSQYASALLALYEAGDAALLAKESDFLRQAQKAEYNLRRDGHPEFRITPPVHSMAGLVEEAVAQEATRLETEGTVIEAEVIDRFLDDVTHRKFFGLR